MARTSLTEGWGRAKLDAAIAAVADREYQRLSERWPRSECATRVKAALRSLTNLSVGDSPDYNDEWVALLYLTWHQPRQIHLAYTALRENLEEPPEKLLLFDVGCGAHATQFALAAAFMDEWTEYKGQIAVVGLDPSGPMRRLGDRLWNELLQATAGIDHELCERFSALMSAMCCRSFNDYEHYAGTDEAKLTFSSCWLTSFHAVYGSTLPSLTGQLRDLRRDFRPELEIISCKDSKAERHRKKLLGPGAVVVTRPEAKWPGELSRTMAWRSGLAGELGDHLDQKRQEYLKASVEWDSLKGTKILRAAE